MALARFHALEVDLYRHLEAAGVDIVPKEVLTELWVHYQNSLCRSRIYAGELAALNGLFSENTIPLIGFKGPVLAILTRGDMVAREFWDLDILVHRHDVVRATELLASRGFRVHRRWAFGLDTGFFASGEFPFSKDGLRVDLHWTVFPPDFLFAPRTEDLFRRARRVAFAGGTILTFSPEDTLLTLCVHGAKHGWTQLNWVCDVANLIGRETIEWAVLFEQSRQLGSSRMLKLGLLLVRDLLGAPLPEAVSDEVARDAFAQKLAAQVIGGLFSGAGGRPALSLGLTIQLKTIENWSAQIRHLLQRARPTLEDWDFIQLPRFLFALYYPRRQFRFVFKRVQGVASNLGSH
jgi:hypothetical protein